MKNYYTLILAFILISQLQAQNEFFFEVLSPNNLEAIHAPGSFTTNEDWGTGDKLTEDIEGLLVYAPLDTGGNHFLCEIPATDYSGKFVFIDRGLCEFGDKALNAQERGAIAVIIRNTDETNLGMAAGMNGNLVNIPVIKIPFLMGEGLAAALENNIPVTVAFTLPDPLGILDLNQQVELNVFPNPMKEFSVFELLEAEFKKGKIEIYDLLGRVVREEEFSQNKLTIERKELIVGTYFYKIILDEKFATSSKIQIVD